MLFIIYIVTNKYKIVNTLNNYSLSNKNNKEYSKKLLTITINYVNINMQIRDKKICKRKDLISKVI